MTHAMVLAIREWRRQPWIAGAIAVTLALCVGANIAVLALLRAVLAGAVPYPDASRLVAISMRARTSSPDDGSATPAAFFAMRSQPGIGSSVAAYYPEWNVTLVEGDRSRRVVASAVSTNMLDVLGLRLQMGRGFTSDEEWTGDGQAIILTHELWQSALGGRRDVLGSQLTLGADGWPLGKQQSSPGGMLFTVIGVLAAGTTLPDTRAELVVPLRALGDDRAGLTARVLSLIGRVGGADGEAERARLTQRLSALSLPGSMDGATPTVTSLRETIVGDTTRFLGMVGGAAGLILLLGVASLATLFLLRSARRSRETAIRVAIGARLTDLLQPVFADTVVFGLLGTGGALLVSKTIVSYAMPLLARELPRVEPVGLDVWITALALGITALCILTTGLFSVCRLPRHAPYGLLRAVERAVSPTVAAVRARATLIIVQFVLGMMLLSAASLLIASVRRLIEIDPGWDARNASAMTMTLPRALFSNPAGRMEYFRRAVDGVAALPGVDAISATSVLPLRDAEERTLVAVTDEQVADPNRRPSVASSIVMPRFFATMGIGLGAGREFTITADSLAPRSAIVNESFVRSHLAGREPLGTTLTLGGGPTPRRYIIVGVAQDAMYQTLRAESEPHVYLNASEVIGSTMRLVVRTRSATVRDAARDYVGSLHPFVQPYDVISLSDVLARATVRERIMAALLAALSGLAVTLFAFGMFGIVGALVSERRREMAVKLALGASGRRLAREVLSGGTRLATVALAVGIPCAWLSARVLRTLLFGVTPNSFWPYAWAIVATAVAALLACIGPIRRVMAIDPMEAMRAD